MAPASPLSLRARPQRKCAASMGFPKACAIALAAFALFSGPSSAHSAALSSSSSSGSGEASLVDLSPQNESSVERMPIELSALNASSPNASALFVDNETITFESLLLSPENMLLPHLQVRGTTNETNTTSEPIAVGVMGTKRIPSDEANSTNAQAPKNITIVAKTPSTTSNSTMPSAGNQTTHVSSSSSSSSSSAGEIHVAGDAITESPAPEIEVHGVPSPPTLVTAAASDGSAEVSWNAPDDDGSDPILEYEVAWIDEFEGKVAGTKAVSQPPSSVVLSQSPSVTGPNQNDLVPTTATISALVNGRSYAFKVRAKNVNGYSTWSAKSLAVSPLHPPDLCGRVTCSGHGTCFPMYQVASLNDRRLTEQAQCLCRPGFNPPDCSVKNDETAFVWKVTEWGECGSGCGGGQRTRSAICWDVALDKPAASAALCPEKKPSLTRICNGMECGSKLVSVRYQVETSFDEVLFSPEAWDAFEIAFTTEVAAALQIPRTRLEVTAIRRGSIVVYFQILPASRVGEQSLNDIVERLQTELGNATSTLRSQGTFARRVETTGVKLSFSIADQTVAGGAEDISIAGLIGTVCVLCLFVALFGLFLRRRHERISRGLTSADAAVQGRNVLNAKRSEMKPMGIRTMA